MLVLAATRANGSTIYVCGDGSGDYVSIQEGLDAAAPGDEVVVCDGTYTGPLNRNLDFAGKAIILRSANGPDHCIIDCENQGRGFYFHSGEPPTAVLDGFTIRNGAVSADDSPPHGGGICCVAGSAPTITNCVITSSAAIDGGGIYVAYSDPLISNCTISANTTGPVGDGGGIYCRASNATIRDCTISDNSSGDDGGGLHLRYSRLTVVNCTFRRNFAQRSGGGAWCWFSTPSFEDCTFRRNSAWQSGAIHCLRSSPLIHNCTISRNTASLAAGIGCRLSGAVVSHCTISENSAFLDGGALLLADGSVTVSNCTLSGNSATYEGGAVQCDDDATLLVNCVISANAAASGGALACGAGRPLLVNCTIADNVVSSRGGAVYSYEHGSPRLVNSILWNNLPEEIFLDSGAIEVSYCDVRGGWPGPGNLEADPLFADPGRCDYHLLSASPCIDAGDNRALPTDVRDADADGQTAEPLPVDGDGRLRTADRQGSPDSGRVDPNFPELALVDLGAYEYQCAGDLDGDGQIADSDLELLLSNYLRPDPVVYAHGDLDLDGAVDLSDLAALLAVYQTACP